MAEQWEYTSFNYFWDSDAKQWKHHLQGVSYSASLSDIFNHFGSQGWELVNFAPDTGTIYTNGMGGVRWPTGFEATAYYAVFKRRKP